MVKVDEKKCIGCGLCISICPEVFELKANGKSYVKEGASCEGKTCCKEAEEGCPVNAITLS